MNRDRSLFDHFELDADALYWGTQHELYASRVRDAVLGRRLIAVIGGFGSGKSVLVRQALESIDNLDLVYVNNPDRERLRIGQVISSVIYDLSSENPRRDNIARNRQVARIVGERVYQQRKEVVVVVENAHRMHANTLLALKDLRESTMYRGRAFLFSVVLVGQEGLRSKLERFGEVQYRTKAIDLTQNGWMSFKERYGYLEQVYGPVIPPSMRDRLAALFTTPLQMDHFIEEKLEAMRDAGIQILDEKMFPLTIRELRESLKLSLRDISKISGVPTSTISDVEHERNDDPETKRAIKDALEQKLAERRAA